MIKAKSWEKFERGISLLSAGMLAAFWLVLMKYGALGFAFAIYMGYEAVSAYRRDHLDERELLIAARAGYLSHKLMITAGLLLFALVDARGALVGVLAIGSLSERAFRRLQGGQQAAPAPAWVWCLVGAAILAFAWGVAQVFNDIAMAFNMTVWQMLRLLYNGSPN